MSAYRRPAGKFLSTSSARRTTCADRGAGADRHISIHVLREEDDCIRSCRSTTRCIFLSTSSARRTTGYQIFVACDRKYFYPRPPRGERLAVHRRNYRHQRISIHVLREEDDGFPLGQQKTAAEFLSTSSARRTTRLFKLFDLPAEISIHVLREEDDEAVKAFCRCNVYISIHVLREEDDSVILSCSSDFGIISIHVLREEDDPLQSAAGSPPQYFYPRPPRGGRRFTFTPADITEIISIHVLREEDDMHPATPSAARCYFYPRPPRGGRPLPSASGFLSFVYFYPRPPRGGRRGRSGARARGDQFLSTSSARRTTL